MATVLQIEKAKRLLNDISALEDHLLLIEAAIKEMHGNAILHLRNDRTYKERTIPLEMSFMPFTSHEIFTLYRARVEAKIAELQKEFDAL